MSKRAWQRTWSSMQMVMGPTPPGTGVIQPAFCNAWLKLTSPTSLYPDFLDASGTALMPTSITAAPGFTQSPVTYSARPHAAIRISASASGWVGRFETQARQ